MKKLLLVPVLLFSTATYAEENVETTYWDCDYMSATSFLSFEDAAACGIVYEKILKEKFAGNFANFMSWWKANKDQEHNIRKKK